ncbi:hypothetical protein ACQ4PT_007868 [Festuca glaucescens]
MAQPSGSWEGSTTTIDEVQCLRRMHRIPSGVAVRVPGEEIAPAAQLGERVVFTTHFDRGFGLPASSFFRGFLEFFGLRPHHLPANAFVTLSCYVAFCEGYAGVWPDVDFWSRLFFIKAQTTDGQLRSCGAASLYSHPQAPFPKTVDSVKKWQTSFFYVKNENPAVDRLNLPPFSLAPPTKVAAAAFAQWVLSIGDGTLPAVARQGESDPTWITIPDEHLVHTDGDKIGAIVEAVYVDFLKRYSDPNYLRERAILTPTNEVAEDVNRHVLSMVPGEDKEYLSCDSTGNSADGIRNIDIFYPVEVLNTVKVNNFPYHKLVLKRGVPIMLLRNISQTAGLCNGTRLIVTRLAEKVIEAVVMTGSHVGDVVYIPRICLTTRDPKWPFTLHRRQFPIRICYAMTINKSQGQTLPAIGLYLKTPVFTHGQFYVAVSRVTSKEALKIMIEKEDDTCGSETRNIVFSEIFQALVGRLSTCFGVLVVAILAVVLISYKMAFKLLSEIHKDSHQWTICVLVSRLWHYRGGTDEGAIQHTDLVLLDTEGNHMYGQIPSATSERLKDVLEEGKVFVIRKFFCNPSKPAFRPVESPFMVQFTKYTTVEERPGLADTYPFCTYSLTSFADIPVPCGRPEHFIDVIGKIEMVSDVIPVQSLYQATASNTRTVILKDLLGNEIRLVLWGDRALEFDAESVRAMGEKEPVIAIFVGTLAKSSHGPGAIVPRAYEPPVEKTLKDLNEVDPFVDMEKNFLCTATVNWLGNDQRWWFASCSMCRKSSKHDGCRFQCSGKDCNSAAISLAYCISFFATDDTGESEFIMFEKVAAGAVGKQLMNLMRQRYPGQYTVDELANAARHDTTIPAEIERLIGQKFKLLVSISKKWNSGNSENLNFQVYRIEETYKPELPPLAFAASSSSAGASSSAGGSGSRLLPLNPVLSPQRTAAAFGRSHS